ncbi:MAG: ATP-binding protein [Burkholderiales bacterium]|nr:ATP-binding protein [Burkholderiales bacterium]
MLDLSKIEAGRLELATTDFDLRASVAEVIELMRVRAERKGLALELQADDAVPHRVHGDPIRLRQVLTNLVGNAIKFTERGSVRVSVGPERGPEPLKLRFEVADTGIGLTAEQSGRIFEAFTQGDASHTRKYGGTGLGLAISRDLVGLMGGEIGVSSLPGRGATFWFTVAVAPSSASAAEPAAAEPMRLPPLAGRVLLVEDNELNRVVARGMLEALGLAVDAATNGLEAMAALAERRHDLVLMDCQMPELDGFEATRRIRVREAASSRPRTPIVALTANAVAGDRERCIAAGMDDYLAKPFRLTDLHETCRRWLHANAASGPPAAAEAPADRTAAAPAALDPAALERLRAMQRPGQPDVVAAVVGLFIDRSATLFASLRDAAAAADAAVARRAAHSLKSNCMHIGATGLAVLFKHAELAAGEADLAAVGRLALRIEPELYAVRALLAERYRPGIAPAAARGGAECPRSAAHVL